MEDECKTHLGTASLASYLTPSDEKLVVNLVKPKQQQLPPAALCSTQKFTCSQNVKKAATAEDEIGVFRAERYYNMKLESDHPRVSENCGSNQGKKQDNRADSQQCRRQKSRSGTPSVSSESSWNSQASLFPSFLRNSFHNSQNKAKGRNILANLSCYRSCSDRKSIVVNKNLFEQKGLQGSDVRKEAFKNEQIPVAVDGRVKLQTNVQVKQKLKISSSSGSTREEQLAYPVSSSQLQKFSKIQDEDPRISLDVFGSNKLDKKELVTMHLEKKLSVLTWDAIPKAHPIQPSLRSNNQVHEDIGSDASSDLFEIENLSGSNGQPYSSRQAPDGISSSMTGNTWYEPSEASIEWSAVTASAADFSSVSDCNEIKKTAQHQVSSLAFTTGMGGKTKATADKDVPKSHPGGLLGCKSHKAVSIAETAYRTSEKLNADSRNFPKLEPTKPASKATS